MASSSSSNEPDSKNSQTSSQLDEMLRNGQITNAIEFYNYYKKLNASAAAAAANTTTSVVVNPSRSSPIPSSSSSSSLSSFSNLSTYSNRANVSKKQRNKVKQPNVGYCNPLDEYAAVMLNTRPDLYSAAAAASYSARNNKIKTSRNAKSFNSVPTNNLYSLGANMPAQQQNSEYSMYALDNAADLVDSVKSRKQQTVPVINRSSQLSINNSTRPINLPLQPPASSIFNQYLIDEVASDAEKTPVNSSFLMSQDVKVVSDLKQSSSSGVNKMSRPLATSNYPVMTSYYQKYQHRSQQQQQPSKKTSDNIGDDDSSLIDYEKRKEDAINRIIHNEKIKQIRQRINEQEMLKEYQSASLESFSHQSKQDEIDSSSSQLAKKLVLRKRASNNKPTTGLNSAYIKRGAYGAQSIPTNYDEYVLHHAESRIHQDTVSSLFDEIDTDLLDESDLVHFDLDKEESGIEDEGDEISWLDGHTRSSYGGGGYSSDSIPWSMLHEADLVSLGLNLTNPQSTFQLKVSIISAEVKNIVNVLKQVNIYTTTKKTYNNLSSRVAAILGRSPLLFQSLERTVQIKFSSSLKVILVYDACSAIIQHGCTLSLYICKIISFSRDIESFLFHKTLFFLLHNK